MEQENTEGQTIERYLFLNSVDNDLRIIEGRKTLEQAYARLKEWCGAMGRTFEHYTYVSPQDIEDDQEEAY